MPPPHHFINTGDGNHCCAVPLSSSDELLLGPSSNFEASLHSCFKFKRVTGIGLLKSVKSLVTGKLVDKWQNRINNNRLK
jgi:hypothetical protein